MTENTALQPAPVTAPAEPLRVRITPQQRAAIILALMEPENAQQVAAEFDDGLVDNAVQGFQQLRIVPPEDLITTVRAFNRALQSDLPVVAGGQRRAEALSSLLTPPAPMSFDVAESFDAGPAVLEPDADAETVWSYVAQLTPAETVRLLKNERPALIAAVARRIPHGNAAAVLDAIPDDRASQAIRLLMGGDAPSDRTYDAVAEALRTQAPGRLAASDAAGEEIEAAAAILNAVPVSRQSTILERLTSDDPSSAKKLESLVLQFGNLHTRLPKTIVPTLFREVNEGLLDQALSYTLATNPETAEFLLSCISQRLAEMIRDRLDEKPAVSAADGDAAQTEIMQILIGWSEQDRFAFKPPPDAES